MKKGKSFRNIIAMMATAVMLFLLSEGNCLKVAAEEPVTYVVKYLADQKEWCYQENRSVFDDTVTSWQVYQLREVLKAGDTVVVYNDTTADVTLDLGSTRFTNLTVSTSAFTVINTGGVQDCYILSNSSCSVNGNITNAHVYDNSLVNFGNNIQELRIHCNDKITSSVGCGGTVRHLYAPSDTLPRTFYDLYDFQAGSLIIDQDGDLNTPDWQYSREPSSQPVEQPTPQPEVQQPETQQPAAQPTPAAPADSDDEYDAVPKTGESNSAFWLICGGVLCMFGSMAIRLKKSKE